MDFNTIELDDEHRTLRDEIRDFMTEQVTDEVLQHELETGDGFSESLHLAMGQRGWILPHWPVERGGAGLDALGVYILERETALAKAPWVTLGTTRLVTPAVERFLDAEIRDEVLQGVANGTVRFCLGYTEPHGGSDIAGARTRAVQDGDDWIVSGSKMFTTGAHNCQYSFLITRSDPQLPKHKGLTMFLMPLDAPGIEIRPIRAFSGERTNMVFYDDVRLHKKYLLGEPNAGWGVLRGPLDAEHGSRDGADDGLSEHSAMAGSIIREVHEAFEGVLDWADTTGPDGRRPADDPAVLERLGRIAMRSDAALVSPDPSGRILSGEAAVWAGSEMLNLLGPEGLVTRGHHDSLAGGYAEYLSRYAQGAVTYGGTVEVFRTIIAQRELGLPRMDYPGSKAYVTHAS